MIRENHHRPDKSVLEDNGSQRQGRAATVKAEASLEESWRTASRPVRRSDKIRSDFSTLRPRSACIQGFINRVPPAIHRPWLHHRGQQGLLSVSQTDVKTSELAEPSVSTTIAPFPVSAEYGGVGYHTFVHVSRRVNLH